MGQPSRVITPDTSPGVEVFLDDDSGYLRWLEAHPNGYVVNSHRRPSATYVILHRAACTAISGTPARGRRWTSQ